MQGFHSFIRSFTSRSDVPLDRSKRDTVQNVKQTVHKRELAQVKDYFQIFNIAYSMWQTSLHTVSRFNVACKCLLGQLSVLAPCCPAWISIVPCIFFTLLQVNKWLIDWTGEQYLEWRSLCMSVSYDFLSGLQQCLIAPEALFHGTVSWLLLSTRINSRSPTCLFRDTLIIPHDCISVETSRHICNKQCDTERPDRYALCVLCRC